VYGVSCQAELELESLMLGDGQSRVELAPNLTYLGRLGVAEIEGLVVAFVSGLYPPHSEKALTNSVAVGLIVPIRAAPRAYRPPALHTLPKTLRARTRKTNKGRAHTCTGTHARVHARTHAHARARTHARTHAPGHPRATTTCAPCRCRPLRMHRPSDAIAA
jgi:hypothetical protein